MVERLREGRALLHMARIIGLAASLLNIVLLLVLVFFNPYSSRGITAGTYGVAAALSALALLVAWACVKIKPVVIFLAALVSLIPHGFYLLHTPGVFRWIGVSNMLYLVAGINMVVALRRGNPREHGGWWRC